MLEGFGTYPVSVCIDLDSYPGPRSHTARFRNRSGWLILAELRIESEGCFYSYSVLAACDEHGQSVPVFQAKNLLECGCSFPSLCDEMPIEELDSALDEQVEAAQRQWVRESNAELSALHENAAEELEILEALTQQHIELCDRQIADMRRRRRLEVLDADESTYFGQFIAELEADQDRAIANLDRRRAALRANVAALESKLLRRLQFKSSVETSYVVHWSAPVTVHDEIATILRDVQDAPPAVRDLCLNVFVADRLAVVGQGLLSTYREPTVRKKQRKIGLPPSRTINQNSGSPEPDSSAPTTSSRWNPERLKILEEMWVAGRTASEIAQAIGGVSRNAVIGKAHRIGLKPRPAPQLPQGNPDQAAQADPAPVNKPYVPPLAKPSPAPEVVVNAAWNPERLNILREMWTAGHSASEIAETLGRVSRNAVIGRAHRMGLKPRPSPSQIGGLTTGAAKTAAPPASPPIAKADREPATGPELIVHAAWTADRLAKLKTLWLGGVPAGEIAAQLGNVSRNAVIGKAYRMGLPVRPPAPAPSKPEQAVILTKPASTPPQNLDGGQWSPERVAKLTQLWKLGLSAAQIAAELGGVSRNAVIGKAKRLGLPMNSHHPPSPFERTT